MKNFDQLLQERRSVRNYHDRAVEKEKIAAILEAARLAPSACNAQPWRFAVVADAALRKAVIADGLGGMIVPNAWAKSAPVIIVACSERKVFTHLLAEKVQGVQYHLIDMGIALEHIALKAAEQGLGTCYIGWFNGKAIHRLLGLSPSWKVECLMTLGYPAETPGPTPRLPVEKISVLYDEKTEM